MMKLNRCAGFRWCALLCNTDAVAASSLKIDITRFKISLLERKFFMRKEDLFEKGSSLLERKFFKRKEALHEKGSSL